MDPPKKPDQPDADAALLALRKALEEIRREALGMHGGWRARVLKVCRTMLGE